MELITTDGEVRTVGRFFWGKVCVRQGKPHGTHNYHRLNMFTCSCRAAAPLLWDDIEAIQ